MQAYYFEGKKILNPVSFFSNKVVIQNETISLDVSRLVLPAQRWEISFRVLSGGDETDLFNRLTANMYAQGTMVMPQLPEAQERTTFTGTIEAKTVSAGVSSVAVTPTGSGKLAKGSFVNINGLKKVYMTTADVDFTDAVQTTMPIFPNLVEDIAANTACFYGDNCNLTYLIDDTVSGLTFQNGVISDPGVIRLIEVRR